LKFLPTDLTRDDLAKQRFLVEARAASRLDHPNICTVHEVGETESGELYIAMALYDGETLQEKIARGPMEPSAVIDVVAQIARGLAKAHAAGIVHRDIKPANVIVTRDGLVKILDFGLAKLSEVSLTKSQSFAGTAGYMAPEQIRGERVTPATDVWALGVTAYEMLTGRHPFQGDYMQAVLYSILNLEPAPIAVEDRPAALVELIRRALIKNPSSRLQTAQDLLEILTAGASGPSAGIVDAPRIRNRRTGSLTIALLAALLLAGGAYFVRTRVTAPAGAPSSGAVQPSPESPVAPAPASHLELISTFAGSHRDASFSPDGKRIVFVNSAAAVPQLWILTLGESQPRQVTFGELTADRPRWSPTDERIVFTRRDVSDPRDQTPKAWSVWVVEPGGEPRKILDQAKNPSWSGDGRRIVFERGGAVWIAAPDGSAQRRIEAIPAVGILLADREPALSPDGSVIAYFQAAVGASGDIWVTPVEGGKARRLTSDEVLGGGPVWTPDGKQLIFSSLRGGSLTLWRVSAKGGTPTPVLISPGDDTEPVLSPDGRRLVYTSARNACVIRATDLLTGRTREIFQSRVIGFATSISPDGKSIVFMGAASNGDIRIYVVPAEGGTAVEAFPQNGEKNLYPHWSEDGKSIYFFQSDPERTFRRFDVGGKTSSVAFPGFRWVREQDVRVDPTESRIVYSQFDGPDAVSTMIHDVATGTETALPVALKNARWSPDGSRIVGKSGEEIVVCGADGKKCWPVAEGRNALWFRGSAEICFFRPGRDARRTRQIWVVPVDGHVPPRQVGEIGPIHPIGFFFSLAPNGEVIWNEFREGRSELWLAELPPGE
ncbi:MAG: protein kinase, partial [Thermoanaerobaculia bacterium]|nr:protein kinase [Thermoanaerobaculia bacterium]